MPFASIAWTDSGSVAGSSSGIDSPRWLVIGEQFVRNVISLLIRTVAIKVIGVLRRFNSSNVATNP